MQSLHGLYCGQKSHRHILEVRNKFSVLRMDVGEALKHYISRCEDVCYDHLNFVLKLKKVFYMWVVVKGPPPDWSLVIMSL